MPSVAELLGNLDVYGCRYRPEGDDTRAWTAECPLCTDGIADVRPLRIWERRAGGPAWLRCDNGCLWWEILADVGWCWDDLQDEVEPEERPRLRLLNVDRMREIEPPPVPWIAQPLLARGAVTMLVGREGTGKSLLALALAAAIGRGEGVAGIACSPGRALVVDAENGEAEAHRRVNGLDVAPGKLGYAEAEDFDLRAHLPDVEALVAQHRPDVLVLDSLRSLAPGLEENDSGPVETALGPLRGLARRQRCAILVLHHAGKASNTYRGSTAIGAAVELGFTLTSDRADSDDDGHRILSCWKSRIAARPGPLAFRIEARDGRVGISAAEARSAPQRAPSREGELTQRFAAIVAERGPLAWGELCRLADADPASGSSRRARALAIEHGTLVLVTRGIYGPAPRTTDRPASIGELAGRSVPDADREPVT